LTDRRRRFNNEFNEACSMNTLAAAEPSAGLLDRAVAFSDRQPGTALAWLLGLHLIVWTALPILVCANLQLDLAEDIALGKEWQLGYWKHPPLPWWLADLLHRLTGQVDSVYVLGPLASVLCLYFVWRFARTVVDPTIALIAVLVLEGVHFYNFSAVKFAHDQVQLPFWALTGWFVYRAVTGKRALDWIASGAFLALAFWSKYAAFALAATIGLILLLDPIARLSWRTRGPYLMAIAFVVVLAPNLYWVATHDFLPLLYVDERAKEVAHWYQYVSYPLQWTVSQLFFLLPALGLIALLFGRKRPRLTAAGSPFARRYVTALALGPFLVTTLVAAALGRLPVAMWGYPLWSFAPLSFLMWFTPELDSRRLRAFALAFAVVFVAFPLAYAADEQLEPLLHDRQKATHFPGRQMAAMVTGRWHAVAGTPLHYVAGAPFAGGSGEFAAKNLSVYSPDHPHVLVHGDPELSPWIDMADFDRRGGVLIWQGPPELPAALKVRFPRADLQAPLVLPQITLVPNAPAVVHYAILPPRH
jgi:4-amino-4-deoxy-L-arabinose transferase-like glycosyltransferase